MIDLTTKYLGLTLKNPLVPSPSPLTEDLANIRRMEDAGAGAVVLHSLFEEQITLESEQLDFSLGRGSEVFAEALTYFPDMTSYNLGPDAYLDLIRKAKAAVEIPIIASLNGVSLGGWTRHAKYMEGAGADAIELNIYHIPNRPELTSEEIERGYCQLVSEVKSHINIPVAVKIHPFFSSLPNMVKKLDDSGADGLVMFNRFYMPDFDLQALEVKPHLELSTPYELLQRLHWVAILYGNVRADMAITGGVHRGEDALKAMMAGAQVAMMTSALLKNSIKHIERVRTEVLEWMEKHEYESIRQMQGSMSRKSVAEPQAFERANYMKVIGSYTLRSRPA